MKISTSSKAIAGGVLAVWGVCASNVAVAKDVTCIDYFTVGESKCQPAASTPVQAPPKAGQAQLLAPADAPKAESDVDKYLENYGKPPREFVEFYLNPTTDNAQKWVGAYQQMLQKGQDMSKSWSNAEQLYAKSSGGAAAVNNTGSPAQAAMPDSQPVSQSVALPAAAPAPVSIGAFSGVAGGASLGGLAGAGSSYNLTYYFSQVCPYCARMTPDLAVLSKEKEGKLALTCVDVTPEGPQSHPEPTYITGKLPCKWRLPEAGEIDSQEVRQTPTLLIQKDGGAPLRLSGYVPLAQLRQYF